MGMKYAARSGLFSVNLTFVDGLLFTQRSNIVEYANRFSNVIDYHVVKKGTMRLADGLWTGSDARVNVYFQNWS